MRRTNVGLAHASSGGASPATTVTGPDAFGAAAVVGVGTLYARNDHDHGLPAAPGATNAAGVLGADVVLVATADTLILTTASLAVGTWLVEFQVQMKTLSTGADAGVKVALGTATATFTGPVAVSAVPDTNSPNICALWLRFIATVTVAGTLQMRVMSTAADTVRQLSGQYASAATGYTAIKVA